MIFVLVLALAVTLGIQNGNDRLLTDRIEVKVAELKTVGTKIGTIKQRDLRTTQDYIQAYSEIEALLLEYEAKIAPARFLEARFSAAASARGLLAANDCRAASERSGASPVVG
jgi:hypothetical protein